MAIRDYAQYDGLGLAELVAKKKVKPIELLDEAIARAEALNPKLNAIIYKDYDRAREAAKAKLPKGVFTGVPFLLKDILAMAQGLPTRQASRFMPPIPWPQRFHAGARSSSRRASSRSARPTCRNSASCRRRNPSSTAPRTIPGISRTRPAARRADRPRRSRRASCRWRMPMTAAARSAFRPRAAASSA